jgi:hypothetical protein
MINNIGTLIIALSFALPTTSSLALELAASPPTPSISLLQSNGQTLISKRKRKKRSKNRRRKSNSRNSSRKRSKNQQQNTPRFMGIGVSTGYETPYGNGIHLHLMPFGVLDISVGGGYNLTGLKLGAGAELLLGGEFGLSFGTIFSHSFGRTGDINFDVNFIPEGSTQSQTVNAAKSFEVSPSNFLATIIGVYAYFSDSVRFELKGSYNRIVSGNALSYTSDVKFSSNIEATNIESFDQEFDTRAADLVSITPLGLWLGLTVFI